MIEIKDVTVIYEGMEFLGSSLSKVNLSVKKGEWINILGPSGSGKSTLLHAIGGQEKLSSGSIFIDGRDLSKFTQSELQTYKRNKIGYVLQDFRLLEG